MKEPLLSACLITYNHARYVRQSIESILAQRADFAWELVVADDFSTDGTREILLEYKERYPQRIRLILQEKNVGPAKNWYDLITSPKSKYIALCEGDDFWGDTDKIQKQVDFLERNPDFIACFHPVRVVDKDGRQIKKAKSSFVHNKDVSAHELITGRVLSTLSLCYRNVIKEFPEEYHRSPTGDNFLCSLLGNYGRAKFLSDIAPSCYRIHQGGAWSLKDEGRKRTTLITSYFWLSQYYERIGKPEFARGFYQKILLEGFYSDPFKGVVPNYLAVPEYVIVKLVRRFFRMLRRLLIRKPITVGEDALK
jgi:glycosyltransferase involved in cell wall biosynthesis